MSSSSDVMGTRSRVLRGAITTKVRSVPFDQSVDGDRPMRQVHPTRWQR